MIGPFFFQHNLSGAYYLEMLRNQILPAVREIVPPIEFNHLWFQQDGCPSHNTRAVRQFLNENFNDRIICNQGPVHWPARSPDLTPLDFYLWGHMKNDVYSFQPPENLQELQARVEDALISVNRNTLRRATSTVVKRCRKCLHRNGGHIEQFN